MATDHDTTALRPVTPAQESMWYEQQFRRRGSNIGCQVVTLRGEVAPEAVRRACAAVVERHPVLRSVFVRAGRGIAQRTESTDTHFTFVTGELSAADGREHARVHDWVKERYGRFDWDLATMAPVRFHLLRHAPDRSTLAVVVHHIGYDGRSKFLFARDFTRFLDQAVRGEPLQVTPLALPDPPPPVDPDLVARAVAYWQDLDVGSLGRTRMPRTAAAARDDGDGLVHSTDRFTIPDADRLRTLAHQEGTTLFGGLVACVAVQLHGYGNRLPVMSVTADTSTPENAHLIGLDINVVPLAVPVTPDTTFRQVLRGARAALDHLRTYRTVPFQALLRGVDGVRSAGPDGPFAGVSLSYPRVPRDLPRSATTELDWDFFVPNFGTAFDITYQFRSRPDTSFGRVDYVPRAQDAPEADRIVRDLTYVVGTVLAHPDLPLHELSLPGADDASATAEPLTPAKEQSDMTAPGPIQQSMLAIWRETFGVDALPLDADFFALGGHSLLAMEMLSRIEEDMGVQLEFSVLAEAPTPAGLAAAAERAMLERLRSLNAERAKG